MIAYILAIDVRMHLKWGFLFHLSHRIDQGGTLRCAGAIPSLQAMLVNAILLSMIAQRVT